MIAAERLGIPLERITYEQSDTATVPRGGGTGGARSLQMGGQAVEKAANELLERARTLAADLLEAAPDDVELADGSFAVRGVPGHEVGWTDVARRAAQQGAPLAVTTDFEGARS